MNENCEKLEREFLSALAAIEKQPHGHGCHLRSARPFGEQRRKEWNAKGCDCWKSKVDLSLLHERDKELLAAIERRDKTLADFRTLLESKPVDCLGTGESSDGMTWPIRDEVIDKINHTVNDK